MFDFVATVTIFQKIQSRHKIVVKFLTDAVLLEHVLLSFSQRQ